MKIGFTFRHMDSNEDLKRHADDKLQRLSRYEESELDVHAIFAVQKFFREVELQANGHGQQFVAKETREDVYEAFDRALDKLERQLARDKSKRKDHHKGKGGSSHEAMS